MFKTLQSTKGISLVELIVVSAIIVTIAAITGSVFLYGYQGYYRENDAMMAETYAMRIMQTIMDDLRKYEDQSTKAIGNVLTVKENLSNPQDPSNLQYTFSNNKILKNGAEIDDNSDINISSFTVGQRTQGLDSKVIDISFTVSYGKTGTRSVSSSYRCKIAK